MLLKWVVYDRSDQVERYTPLHIHAHNHTHTTHAHTYVRAHTHTYTQTSALKHPRARMHIHTTYTRAHIHTPEDVLHFVMIMMIVRRYRPRQRRSRLKRAGNVYVCCAQVVSFANLNCAKLLRHKRTLLKSIFKTTIPFQPFNPFNIRMRAHPSIDSHLPQFLTCDLPAGVRRYQLHMATLAKGSASTHLMLKIHHRPSSSTSSPAYSSRSYFCTSYFCFYY